MKYTIVPVNLGPKTNTKLTSKQVQALEKFYKCHSKPSKTLRRELSSQLKIPLDQVDRWFRNRSTPKVLVSFPSPSRTIVASLERTCKSTSSSSPKIAAFSASPVMDVQYGPIILPRLTDISTLTGAVRSDPALYSLSA